MPSPHEVYQLWITNPRLIVGKDDYMLLPTGESMELTFVVGNGNDRQAMVLVRLFDQQGSLARDPIGPLVIAKLYHPRSRERSRTEDIAHWYGLSGNQVRSAIRRVFIKARLDAAQLRLLLAERR